MNIHLGRAERLMELHRFEAAIPHLLAFLAEAPNDARAHTLMARCFLNVQELRQAKSQIEEALHHAPDYAYAHYIHSYVLDRLNRRNEARFAIQEALRLAPTEPDYLTRSADLWIAEAKYDAAIRDIERGLESNPNHLECNCNLAFVLMCQQKYAASEAVTQRILQQHPDHATVHATYGWLARYQNKYRLAKRHFTESLRIDPEGEWAKSGLRESLNTNFFWTYLERLEGNNDDSVRSYFGFLYLCGCIYFAVWFLPWIEVKNPKPTTTANTVTQVSFAAAAILLCLSILIGKSLSDARLAICAQGRHLMQPDELRATLAAWIFGVGASVILLTGLFSSDRKLYVAGCVVLWGAVPVTCIWKYRGSTVRGFFLTATLAYFVSAIVCFAG
ncbi:MAG: Tetratricopeptide 1 repeat-containing protein, partial [Planctomycetaceae bacterium]|nr:Tetratricopeptide 1 repeat-containing protein [Planctomycetaceae bacterium]